MHPLPSISPRPLDLSVFLVFARDACLDTPFPRHVLASHLSLLLAPCFPAIVQNRLSFQRSERQSSTAGQDRRYSFEMSEINVELSSTRQV